MAKQDDEMSSPPSTTIEGGDDAGSKSKISKSEMFRPSSSEVDILPMERGASIFSASSAGSFTSLGEDMDAQPSKPLALFVDDNLPTTRRGCVRRIILSVSWNVFMTCVILTDFASFIVEVSEFGFDHDVETETPEEEELRLTILYISYATIAFYSLEIALSLWVFGCPNYFKAKLRVLDFAVVFLSLLLIEDPSGQAVVLARLGRSVRMLPLLSRMARCARRLLTCTRCCCKAMTKSKQVARMIRRLVSKAKSRYIDEKNNIDLDLTYITHDTIAFGCPVEGLIERIWRNPMQQVLHFFELRHKGHFRVYNACPEKPYNDSRYESIGGSVYRIQVQDHSPPRLDQIVDFLNDTRTWKKEHSKNVVAVHCKAGKGRTGTLLCSYLLYSKQRKLADEAMIVFAKRRTDPWKSRKIQGIETPSQMRYVRAIEKHLKQTKCYIDAAEMLPHCQEPKLALKSMKLDPDFLLLKKELKQIQVVIQSLSEGGVTLHLETDPLPADSLVIPLNGTVIAGDIRVSIFKAVKEKNAEHHVDLHNELLRVPHVGKARGIIAYFRFHTAFMPRDLRIVEASTCEEMQRFHLQAKEVDKACKGIKKKKHGPKSSLTLEYVTLAEASEDDNGIAAEEAAEDVVVKQESTLNKEVTGLNCEVPCERPAHFPAVIDMQKLAGRMIDSHEAAQADTPHHQV